LESGSDSVLGLATESGSVSEKGSGWAKASGLGSDSVLGLATGMSWVLEWGLGSASARGSVLGSALEKGLGWGSE
jgi:hypothetical protein